MSLGCAFKSVIARTSGFLLIRVCKISINGPSDLWPVSHSLFRSSGIKSSKLLQLLWQQEHKTDLTGAMKARGRTSILHARGNNARALCVYICAFICRYSCAITCTCECIWTGRAFHRRHNLCPVMQCSSWNMEWKLFYTCLSHITATELMLHTDVGHWICKKFAFGFEALSLPSVADNNSTFPVKPCFSFMDPTSDVSVHSFGCFSKRGLLFPEKKAKSWLNQGDHHSSVLRGGEDD